MKFTADQCRVLFRSTPRVRGDVQWDFTVNDSLIVSIHAPV